MLRKCAFPRVVERGYAHATAVRLRLRRNYALLFYFITAVWLTKLFIHRGEDAATSFYERLAVGDLIPSWFVAGSASLFVLVITALSAATACREPIERDYRQEQDMEDLEAPRLELDPPG